MREIIDEDFKEMLNGMMKHDLEPFKIYNAGDYEKECLVLIARQDCCLYDFILFQVSRTDEDLPDHARSHFLTFDDLELKAGDRVCIYTCRGKDFQQDMPDSGRHYEVVYWNLDAPIWKKEDNEIEIMERGNSVAVNLSPDRVKDF